MLRHPSDPPSDLLTSVVRAAEILDQVGNARPPGSSVQGVAMRLGIPKASAYHYTRSMLWLNLLQRWDPGTYILGFGIFDLARALSRQLTVAQDNLSVDEIATAMGRDPAEIKDHLDFAAVIMRSS
jgi:DNA-binding IclR family transcriptional regulator